jgi:hypothetical protein
MSNKRTFQDDDDDCDPLVQVGEGIDTDDMNWSDLLYAHSNHGSTDPTTTTTPPKYSTKPVTGSQESLFSDTPIRVLLPIGVEERRSSSSTGNTTGISHHPSSSHHRSGPPPQLPNNPLQHLQQQQHQQPTQPQPQQHRQESSSDYDSDTEPPPVFLDWRSDHTKNFSDWRIDVVVVPNSTNGRRDNNRSGGGGGTSILKGSYHVHRNILVVESEYFQRLFENDRTYPESENSASTIELVEEGAASFEALLDYMYRPGEPNLTSYNAVAMHHFGEYFGMKRLRWLARQFWKNDLNANTIATYYRHAGIFMDEKVMQAVKRKCCSVPFLIEAGSSGVLLDVPDPQLWFFLLKNFNGSYSIPMSAFVTEYCDRHNVDAVTFVQMTTKTLLPEIFFDVAQQLVVLEKKILGDHVDVTCLQNRCITALAKEWKRIDVTSDHFSSFLANQSSKFSAELFKQSMLAARSHSEDVIPPPSVM